MRLGRTDLIAEYLRIHPGPGPLLAAAANDGMTREQLTAAIITLEREEPPADVADDV